jgi:hypothetical protein
MSAKKYQVALTTQQREKTEIVARSYKRSARERARARVLLLADNNHSEGGCTDRAICQQAGVCCLTVSQIRQRFTEGGLDAALYRAPQKNRKVRVLDGSAEAFLIATVCGAPPEGHKRWVLSLLQSRLIEAGYLEAVSHETVRQTLKKMNLSPG